MTLPWLVEVLGGWSDDTSTYAKRYNRNDFSRSCLVVIFGGDSPVKWLDSEDRLGTIHFSKNLLPDMTGPKGGFPPDYPKQCPCAHKHLSWSPGDEEVYCWDCNKKYPISECFRTQQVRRESDAKQAKSNDRPQ